MRWIFTIICFLSLPDVMGQHKTLFLAAGQSNAVGQGDSAVIKAKAAARKTGLPVAGILWSQGERDANAVNAQQLSPEEYEQQLTLLIRQFRTALGKQLNFYIIQTGYYLHHPTQGFDAVRKAQENVAGKMKHVFIVYRQTDRFNEKGWMKDEIHYHQPALNDIGSEVAKQVALKEKK